MECYFCQNQDQEQQTHEYADNYFFDMVTNESFWMCKDGMNDIVENRLHKLCYSI
jgi:hypothetical protein